MEDPQVIIEKIKIAQAFANSAISVRHYELGQLGAQADGQTNAWLKVFDEAYKGITKTVSGKE